MNFDGRGMTLEPLPDSVHMCIERQLIIGAVIAARLFNEYGTGYDRIRSARQQTEQLEFLHRQQQRLSIDRNLVLLPVNHDIANLNSALHRASEPPQDNRYSEQQLLGLEGLDQIII